MREKRYGTLGGLTVPVMVYAAFADVTKVIGSEEKAVDILNDNLHYRGGPAKATRDFICEHVQGLKEVKGKKDTKGRPVDSFLMEDTGEKDDKGQPVMARNEAEGAYIDRVCAVMGWTTEKGTNDLKFIQPAVDKWAAEAYSDRDDKGNITKVLPLAVDAAEPERKPKAPPKLSDEDKAIAAEFFDGKKDYAKLHKEALKYGITLVAKAQLPKERDKAIETIGWVVKGYFKAKRDEAAALAKAAF